jgi:cytidine deaminase
MILTSDEERLIEHAKEAVVRYNRQREARGDLATLYAFVMSDSGKIYDGACFESSISSGIVCGEKHAIANMVAGEGYHAKVKHVIVSDPAPDVRENSTTPCGTCRHIIWERGTDDATIICMQYIRHGDGWIFPKIEKYTISELYPHSYMPAKWD